MSYSINGVEDFVVLTGNSEEELKKKEEKFFNGKKIDENSKKYP